MSDHDEGEAFQLYTGRIILDKPGGIGRQILDSKVTSTRDRR